MKNKKEKLLELGIPQSVVNYVATKADEPKVDELLVKFGPKPKDFRFENHGSIVLMFPLSEAAKAWTDEYVGDENTMHYNGAIVIEPRYVPNIVDGIREEGFSF